MTTEDPYATEEYARFVESVVHLCRCEHPFERPCDGVLAGGFCDQLKPSDWMDDDDED